MKKLLVALLTVTAVAFTSMPAMAQTALTPAQANALNKSLEDIDVSDPAAAAAVVAAAIKANPAAAESITAAAVAFVAAALASNTSQAAVVIAAIVGIAVETGKAEALPASRITGIAVAGANAVPAGLQSVAIPAIATAVFNKLNPGNPTLATNTVNAIKAEFPSLSPAIDAGIAIAQTGDQGVGIEGSGDQGVINQGAVLPGSSSSGGGGGSTGGVQPSPTPTPTPAPTPAPVS